MRTLPPAVPINLPQHGLLRVDVLRRLPGFRGEDEQEERAVSSQRDASDHGSRLVVDDVDVVVARAIAFSLEGGDRVAQIFLEASLRTEDELAHPGVQAVRADDKIEPSRRRALELDMRCVCFLVNRGDLIAEDHLRARRRLLEQEAGKPAARNGDEPAPGKRIKTRHAEPGDPVAAVAHDAKLADVVADRLERVGKPHPLGDVIAKSPEIDHVAAGAQARRALDERGFKTGGVQPEGERRPGDARA